MTFSFQTIIVGAVVTVAHLAAILAIRPATLEASKYFHSPEMDAFVAEVLVKSGSGSDPGSPERVSDIIAQAETVEEEAGPDPQPESVDTSTPVEKVAMPVPDSTVEFAESFIDLEKERESMKAVTDVRVFSGRIEQPSVRQPAAEKAAAEAEKAPEEPARAEPPVIEEPAAEKKPSSAGPFKLREIRPVTRS